MMLSLFLCNKDKQVIQIICFRFNSDNSAMQRIRFDLGLDYSNPSPNLIDNKMQLLILILSVPHSFVLFSFILLAPLFCVIEDSARKIEIYIRKYCVIYDSKGTRKIEILARKYFVKF